METPKVTIRRANSNDVSLLTDLGAQTFAETFGVDNTEEDMAAYVAEWFNLERQAQELSERGTIFLIAEVEESPAGYAKLHPNSSTPLVEGSKPIELVRLYVSRRWLGSGVGAALMRSCLEESRKAGYETIWLGVWEHNERAQAFYRKWGFGVVGEHPFQLGADIQRDLLMSRPLDE